MQSVCQAPKRHNLYDLGFRTYRVTRVTVRRIFHPYAQDRTFFLNEARWRNYTCCGRPNGARHFVKRYVRRLPEERNRDLGHRKEAWNVLHDIEDQIGKGKHLQTNWSRRENNRDDPVTAMHSTKPNDTHETKGNARATALPGAEWLAYRRCIFLKGTNRSRLFFSAHALSHRVWRATIISPVVVSAKRVSPLNGVTTSATSSHLTAGLCWAWGTFL